MATRFATAESILRSWSAGSRSSRCGACWSMTACCRACSRPRPTRSASTPATRAPTCRRRSRRLARSGASSPCSTSTTTQARDDLALASVMALSFVAQSARGFGQPPVPQSEIDALGLDRRALPPALARRSRPPPRARDRRLLDGRRGARNELVDLHGARDHLDRRRRRRGAVGRGRRALGPAARRRAGARAADAR